MNQGPGPDAAEPEAGSDLYQAELTLDQLDALLRDLQSSAQIVSVTTRGSNRDRASGPAGGESMDEAMDGLRRRTLGAVQIRYRFEGVNWVDTLTARGANYTLIRARHHPPP